METQLMNFGFVVAGIILVLQFRTICIQKFKVSYYESKLENRDVDISRVKNISFREVLFM